MPRDPRPPLPAYRLRPHADRLSPSRPDREELIRLHEEAVRSGLDWYLDPSTGAIVFTARMLWDRGYCCDAGCRHCPYLEGPRP